MFPGPGSSSTRAEGVPLTIYVQVYKAGVTEPPGQGAGIMCQIYYGEVITFGGSWLNTNTINMTYNVDIGNNDEYQGDLTPAAGNYEFTCRCSDDFGMTWVWVDLGAAGNGQLTVEAPLPVNLTQFTARQNDQAVSLHWATASESNHSHFALERSANGVDWDYLGQQQSRGNGEQEETYVFIDDAPLEGKNYYRLRIVGLDSKEVLSKTISVRYRPGNFLATAYPNPVEDRLYFKLPEKARGPFTFELYNNLGQFLHRQNLPAEETPLMLGAIASRPLPLPAVRCRRSACSPGDFFEGLPIDSPYGTNLAPVELSMGK